MTAMLILALLAGAYGVFRLFNAAADSLRNLPRSNDDWHWY